MLKVHYLCSYYPQRMHDEYEQRTQPLWDAYKFCNAVKRKAINGFLTVPFVKNPVKINKDNVGRARQIFGQFIALTLKDEGVADCILVPIPSKDSFDLEQFRSLEMIQEACHGRNLEVRPLVRYTAKLQPASQGGDRSYDVTFNNVSIDNSHAHRPVVLVDDLVTSGASMLAVKDRLVAAGYNVLFAVACGRTQPTLEKAFKPRAFELDEHIGEFDDF